MALSLIIAVVFSIFAHSVLRRSKKLNYYTLIIVSLVFWFSYAGANTVGTLYFDNTRNGDSIMICEEEVGESPNKGCIEYSDKKVVTRIEEHVKWGSLLGITLYPIMAYLLYTERKKS